MHYCKTNQIWSFFNSKPFTADRVSFDCQKLLRATILRQICAIAWHVPLIKQFYHHLSNTFLTIFQKLHIFCGWCISLYLGFVLYKRSVFYLYGPLTAILVLYLVVAYRAFKKTEQRSKTFEKFVNFLTAVNNTFQHLFFVAVLKSPLVSPT